MATTASADQLQFVHFWRFEVQSTFSMRDADNFSTTYGPRMYEWCIRIDRGDTFGFRNIEHRVLLKARSQSCPVVDDPHGNRGYYCPQNSDLGITLQKMLRGNESRLDFTIRCRDGDIIVAKEGVFLASEYFRDYFAAQPDHKDANFGDVNKQAVMIIKSAELPKTPKFSGS
ncbi:unnamed protein product [Nippostrongylus brasiliensis]|uniref:MATH domain-containing protein n=1 Tax=Nippostrongylus brasiliensis TaxID=27835 RepID=A0A0N4YMQ4_NIPBR|nr:unnamed protein product [Nippostrongylus brasiliensis]